ncbi:MAG: hypothetical protein PHF63_02155 [Herbinix sp.]|jgi:hypothetical protein|nr:hypothetical protein [Herbinix sp.]
MTIQFSPELVEVFPLYLGMTLRRFVKSNNFKYSLAYMSYVTNGHRPVTQEFNTELNRIFKQYDLDFTDLENMYALVELIESGS